MDLKDAILCSDCDFVYDKIDKICPRCAGRHGWPIRQWLDRKTLIQAVPGKVIPIKRKGSHA